jgi:hypothetical protein
MKQQLIGCCVSPTASSRAKIHFGMKRNNNSTQTTAASAINASPINAGICQISCATRQASPRPARPMTMPKKAAGMVGGLRRVVVRM